MNELKTNVNKKLTNMSNGSKFISANPIMGQILLQKSQKQLYQPTSKINKISK